MEMHVQLRLALIEGYMISTSTCQPLHQYLETLTMSEIFQLFYSLIGHQLDSITSRYKYTFGLEFFLNF